MKNLLSATVLSLLSAFPASAQYSLHPVEDDGVGTYCTSTPSLATLYAAWGTACYYHASTFFACPSPACWDSDDPSDVLISLSIPGESCTELQWPNDPITVSSDGKCTLESVAFGYREIGGGCEGPPSRQNPKSVIAAMMDMGPAGPDSDLPRPDPSLVVNFRDTGPAQAPARVSGTACVFLKKLTRDRIMLWTEPLGLKVQNVSNKTITKMDVTIVLDDGVIRPNRTVDTVIKIMELEFTDPGHHAPIKSMEIWSEPFDHIPGPRKLLTISEYEQAPKHTPSATGVITFAEFSDGSTYGKKAPPPPQLQRLLQHRN